MDTETVDIETRMAQLFKEGCPKCGQREFFKVDSTQQIRCNAYPTEFATTLNPRVAALPVIDWGETEYIATVSYDFIICPKCEWEETRAWVESSGVDMDKVAELATKCGVEFPED